MRRACFHLSSNGQSHAQTLSTSCGHRTCAENALTAPSTASLDASRSGRSQFEPPTGQRQRALITSERAPSAGRTRTGTVARSPTGKGRIERPRRASTRGVRATTGSHPAMFGTRDNARGTHIAVKKPSCNKQSAFTAEPVLLQMGVERCVQQSQLFLYPETIHPGASSLPTYREPSHQTP